MIIGHMVVGPGEADRYLKPVLDRALSWADLMTVAVDVRAGEAELQIIEDLGVASYKVMERTWTDSEGLFRQEAWDWMADLADPSPEDHILLIDADEVVHDPAILRLASREFPGKRIGFTFHEMWSPTEYRIDGYWKPYDAYVMIPFRPHGAFRDRPIACGREPQYAATTIPNSGVPVSAMLHYGYAREADREAKFRRYMQLDGGKYHNLEHLKSILRPASTATWTKGGLLDV